MLPSTSVGKWKMQSLHPRPSLRLHCWLKWELGTTWFCQSGWKVKIHTTRHLRHHPPPPNTMTCWWTWETSSLFRPTWMARPALARYCRSSNPSYQPHSLVSSENCCEIFALFIELLMVKEFGNLSQNTADQHYFLNFQLPSGNFRLLILWLIIMFVNRSWLCLMFTLISTS